MKSVMAGGIHRAAGAWPHDGADLGHHARGQHVAAKYLAVGGQRDDALLDAGAARVVEANHRCAALDGQVHDLADLFPERAGKRSAEHCKILAEQKDRPAFNLAETGYHAIARDHVFVHVEVMATVHHKTVKLLKRAFIDKLIDAFAGRELALVMLGLDAFFAATQSRLVIPAL